MMKKRSLLLLLLAPALALAVSTTPAQDEYSFRVIAHPEVRVDWISKSDASDYFLKKTPRWTDGADIKPIDLNVQEVRNEFSTAIHDRSRSAIKKYWQRQIFTGRGTPPPEKDSEREIVEFVSSTPGAIGYVSSGYSLGGAGVKVLKIN
ncbi:MAG: hypothetical protein K0U98_12535 [Deltaproteobacteria bacterium]|nr:hypothetical protein [Deltaproteobacteria bacterium]